MTATATATKTAKKQPRTAKLMQLGTTRVLALTTGKDTVFYRLESLSATVGCGFRLSKAERGDGPAEEYDVLLDGQFSSCECKGFLRWNHCKHLESLAALVKCGAIQAPACWPASRATEVQPEPQEPDADEIDAMGETPESLRARDEYEALHHSGIAPWM